MIDNEGHIIHIDYGFLLSNAPGKGLKFERAPFKMTEEFMNLLQGPQSKKFKQFRKLMIMYSLFHLIFLGGSWLFKSTQIRSSSWSR